MYYSYSLVWMGNDVLFWKSSDIFIMYTWVFISYNNLMLIAHNLSVVEILEHFLT